MHHRKIYEKYHKGSLLPGIEIHHIDGNKNNNEPSNLKAVSIEEHLAIHKAQNDHGAVQAILMRMETIDTEHISEAARQQQLKLIEKGTHNFQRMSAEERTARSKKAGAITVKERLGIHAINNDPILSKKNSSLAGKAAQLKRRQQPDLTYLNQLGGKAVAQTTWFTNKVTGERRRAKTIPEGKNWVQGMGAVNSQKKTKY